MVFVFGSVYMMDYVCRFTYVEPALHPRDEADLILMDKLFSVLLDLVVNILLRIFTLMFIMNIGLKFFLLCVSARFWYQDNAGLIK